MRLLLDENLDWRLRHDLLDHQVESVPLIGWAGIETITQSRRGWIRCARDDGQQHGAPAKHGEVSDSSDRTARAVEPTG